jgi:4-hydroxy-3-methylbut-2-en-1-yl diphosphate synthase IspG/GcpE
MATTRQKNKKKESTKQITLGALKIGGGVVQPMAQTDTRDVGSTVSQVRELKAAGCEDSSAKCRSSKSHQKKIRIPLIEDIHLLLMVKDRGLV